MDEIAHTARADAVAGQHPVPLLRCQWVGGEAVHHSVQRKYHDRVFDGRRNQSESTFSRIEKREQRKEKRRGEERRGEENREKWVKK